MEELELLFRDLKTRGLVLRLYFTDRPKDPRASRPFQFTRQKGNDVIGIELYGTIENITDTIVGVVEKSIEDVYRYLDQNNPIQRIPVEVYDVGGTGTPVLNSLF